MGVRKEREETVTGTQTPIAANFVLLRSFSDEEQTILAILLWGHFMIGGHEGTVSELMTLLERMGKLSEEDFWRMRLEFPFEGPTNINYQDFDKFFNGQEIEDWKTQFTVLTESEQAALVMVFVIATMSKKEGANPTQVAQAISDELDGVAPGSEFEKAVNELKPLV